jgi:SAM-dependent MidA family methyltransferase
VARRRRGLPDDQEGIEQIGNRESATADLQALIRQRIRECGPMTVAAFMEIALYHPECGYYARASRRSGSAGDFFTSADTGPLFGELLAVHIANMAASLGSDARPFTIVEAGAGDGRLAHAMMRALERTIPSLAARTRLHLVERSALARAAQRRRLEPWQDRAVASESLPDRFEGVLVANELLDAMPVHQLQIDGDQVREVFVVLEGERLVTRAAAVSDPALTIPLTAAGVTLAPGSRAEVSPAAVHWVRDAARRLERGFLILIDYGRDALFGANPEGTLTTFRRHHQPDGTSPAPWLDQPGSQDITAHVDFTAVRTAAESEGCVTLGFMDQTYFLLAAAARRLDSFDVAERQSFKTLILPGGLGSTMKVLVLGKQVGSPSLLCTSGRSRVT